MRPSARACAAVAAVVLSSVAGRAALREVERGVFVDDFEDTRTDDFEVRGLQKPERVEIVEDRGGKVLLIKGNMQSEALYPGRSFKDLVVDVKVKKTRGAYAGITVRGKYRVFFKLVGRIVVCVRHGGAKLFESRRTWKGIKDAYHDLRIVCVGSELHVYVNGEHVTSQKGIEHVNGPVVFHSHNADSYFDDLRIDTTNLSAAGPRLGESGGAATAKEVETYFLRRGDTVLALGDAITVDGGMYELALGEDLRDEYPDLLPEEGNGRSAIRLVNEGVPGATASDCLRRLSGLIGRNRPNAAIVCFGATDFYKNHVAYLGAMSAIVRELRSKRVAVTVLTPPPIDTRQRPEFAAFSATLDGMVDQLRDFARRDGVLLADCYGPMKRVIEEDGKELSWGDGIHPNDAGRRMMADALQKAWGFGKPLK